MKETLKQQMERFPESPGIYLMKGREGELLYVGKAKNLRARVRNYFLDSTAHSPKTRVLLSKVEQIDLMVTDSEVEAFILESNLIKKHRPRYNILLRDDKHYPYLRLSVNEPYPRLDVVRRIRKDGARYFGPYVPGSGLRTVLDLIEKTFPLRQCKGRMGGGEGRPCLNAQIGRCLSPCAGGVSRKEYGALVRQVILFLQGRDRELLRVMRRRMERAAGDLDFEQAARMRDRIGAIERVSERQKMISSSLEDKDILGLVRREGTACLVILFVRGGKLLGKKEVFVEAGAEEAGLLQTLVSRYYHADRLIPPRIFLPEGMSEQEVLEQSLSSLRGRRVRLTVPRRGVNVRLVGMARENAEVALATYLHQKGRNRDILKALQDAAGLRRLPLRVECFDISNIQGAFPVGSMVVFEEGRPRKGQYRRFRIRSVEGANDTAMMEEVLARRYREEDEASLSLPDLILVDGGRGQLRVLAEIAGRKEALRGRDLMALAKARKQGGGREAVDRIFLPGRKEPLVLEPEDPAFHLLQRIRDESHRFAVAYYRKRHGRETLASRLTEIRGVGKKRMLALLRRFGSLERVREAGLQELMEVPSMNRAVADRIVAFFKEQGEQRR